MRLGSDRVWILAGWWLFVLSALLFAVNAWRTGDTLGLAGALAFLAANICFMIPVYRVTHEEKDDS